MEEFGLGCTGIDEISKRTSSWNIKRVEHIPAFRPGKAETSRGHLRGIDSVQVIVMDYWVVMELETDLVKGFSD